MTAVRTVAQNRPSAQIIPFKRQCPALGRRGFLVETVSERHRRQTNDNNPTASARARAGSLPARNNMAAFAFVVILGIVAGFILRQLLDVQVRAEGGMGNGDCAWHDICGR